MTTLMEQALRQSLERQQLLDYIMESNLFDYELVKQSETFALKKYKDSHYKGDL